MKIIYKLSFVLNVLLIILVGILGYNYLNSISTEPEEVEEKPTIVVFGDSIIKGGKWGDLLDRDDVKNSGFPGFTTSHLRWLIQANVIEVDPQICFLEGGINDIGVGIPLERIKSNYKSLIDTLISHSITPIIQSTLYQEKNPESKLIVDSLNCFLIDYCKQKSVRFLNINSKLSTDVGLKPEYSRDGTHITEAAYIIWGNEMKKVLKEVEDRNSRNLAGN